ncbi:hypothetical protein Pst134EA_013008 [Puccinia striiformis f. sp. tritici]|nr:hypothetical protein Pst134EA_013008 [Puccinia striiformis f. sp. tritici]KAH9453890.1 hypothetical protein Pst134EB_013992 [Puccinia striiformis f. sp. tritici]KAH9465112.1 hypothetical protein Pst134EA_013008 [Puccinia striiformis f. sp. tritici]
MAFWAFPLILSGDAMGLESSSVERWLANSPHLTESTGEVGGTRHLPNLIRQHTWSSASPTSRTSFHRPTVSLSTGSTRMVEKPHFTVDISPSWESRLFHREALAERVAYPDLRKPTSPSIDVESLGSSHALASYGGSIDERDDCAVCLGFLDSDTLSLKCEHVFHRECINQWLRHNPSCPSCRAAIPQDSEYGPPGSQAEQEQGNASQAEDANNHTLVLGFPVANSDLECFCWRFRFFCFFTGVACLIVAMIFVARL